MAIDIFPTYAGEGNQRGGIMQERFDAIIVGTGINALVAGALLAKDGWRVLLCERNDKPGGAIATSTDTFPGYTVELLS
ncbi:MAG: NAD(P)-binding protein, partial [Candidatus Nanopelagicales bacterium]|nr:NAD(P)-binding protein [Candidatus Nanopelagicales bacterium]